jgi:hypothetical protein
VVQRSDHRSDGSWGPIHRWALGYIRRHARSPQPRAALEAYVALVTYSVWGKPFVVRQKTIVRETGIPLSTLKEGIRQLDEMGMLGRTARYGPQGKKASEYELVVHRDQFLEFWNEGWIRELWESCGCGMCRELLGRTAGIQAELEADQAGPPAEPEIVGAGVRAGVEPEARRGLSPDTGGQGSKGESKVSKETGIGHDERADLPLGDQEPRVSKDPSAPSPPPESAPTPPASQEGSGQIQPQARAPDAPGRPLLPDARPGRDFIRSENGLPRVMRLAEATGWPDVPGRIPPPWAPPITGDKAWSEWAEVVTQADEFDEGYELGVQEVVYVRTYLEQLTMKTAAS